MLTRWALADLARHVLDRVRRTLSLSRVVRPPDRLLYAPQDLRAADPEVAVEFRAGHLDLAGVSVTTSASPFRLPPPSPAWEAELFGLGWLRHLRAGEARGGRDAARALVADLLGPSRGRLRSGLPASPAVTARRTISLLAHSPLLLPGADAVVFRRLLTLLGRDVARLDTAMRSAPVPLERLVAAVAFCTACLCCGGYERKLAKRGTRRLSAALARQIRPDGQHTSRSPAVGLELLLDLLPLRRLFASRGLDVPPALDEAIRRLAEALRRARHGSGDLGLFNGTGRVDLGELSAALALAGPSPRPGEPGGPSDLVRLDAAGTTVLLDAGPLPALEERGASAAGTLSFELSDGPDRIVVNGGDPGRNGERRFASRLTRAHSTLVLDGRSQGVPLRAGSGWAARRALARLGPVLLGGADAVTFEEGREGECLVVLAHADICRDLGVSHRRRLRVHLSGDALDGEDVVVLAGPGRAAIPATLRFHLHPAVRAEPDGTGDAVLLRLPGGSVWRFSSEGGGRPRLLPDSFAAVPEGARPATTVVLPVAIPAEARRIAVRWRFGREASPAA